MLTLAHVRHVEALSRKDHEIPLQMQAVGLAKGL